MDNEQKECVRKQIIWTLEIGSTAESRLYGTVRHLSNGNGVQFVKQLLIEMIESGEIVEGRVGGQSFYTLKENS